MSTKLWGLGEQKDVCILLFGTLLQCVMKCQYGYISDGFNFHCLLFLATSIFAVLDFSLLKLCELSAVTMTFFKVKYEFGLRLLPG